MSKPSRRPSTYDNPWKEVLERYFPDFMAFFFPQAHGDIDWARGHEFLAKELRRVTPDAALGERRVDELAKVWRKDGVEAWVLVHVEVQSQQDTDFAERMNQYAEAQHMPYITSVERMGMEKGVQRAVVRMLQLRFGAIPAALLRRLEKLEVSRLEELMGPALQADSLEGFSQALELQPA